MSARAAVGLALLIVTPCCAMAQKVPVVRLKPADARLDEEFTSLSSVRELSDGRVLIADWQENRLVVANLRDGTVKAVGRTGSGPGEFRGLYQLFVLGRDSTLVPDLRARRWLLLDGVSVVVTLPPETPVLRVAPILLGADEAGHVLTMGVVRPGPREPADPAESVYVVRADRATGRADTVGRILPQPSQVEVRERNPDGSPRTVTGNTLMLSASEQALLFLDGWIAFARLNPYRVDWRTSDGRIVRGAALPVPVDKVDDREKRAYVERSARQSGRPPRDPATITSWSPTVAPFQTQGALLASSDGRLVIHRMQTASAPHTRYDVVDRRGALAVQVSMPENERIVGFGAKSVYVAVTDDDGIQRLRRHPWP